MDLPIMDGYMRLSIENDWTSYDSISGTVTVTLTFGEDAKADEKYKGELNNYDDTGFFEVGFGTGGVLLQLSWENDWTDRKSVVQGKSVDLGGRRIIKKKINKNNN